MKKLNLSRILIAVSLLTFFALSCKKDTSIEDPIHDAKEWYLKNKEKATYTLKSSKNEVIQVKREVNWTEAKTFTFEDGTSVLSVPVTVKLANGVGKGSYLMLISKSSGDYKAQMVYNAQRDYFKEQRSVAEINQLFNSLNNASSPTKTATIKINGKVMSDEGGGGMSDEPNCIDWYWVEPIYDGNGNMIGEVWTYLNRTCSTTGGGDGGGGENEQGLTFVWGAVDNSDGSNTLLSIDSAGNEKHNINWTCYKINGNQLLFQSYERVTIGRYGYSNYYWIEGTQHENITPNGSLDNGESAELLLNVATDLSTPEYAQMELSVKEKRTITLNNRTTVKTSGPVTARSRAWPLSRFGH